MVWEAIMWANGKTGTLLVTHGKTTAARRVIPMTPRIRVILQQRWEATGRPSEGWVWRAPTRSGHIESSSLKKQHANTFKKLREEAIESLDRPPRPFVLYDLRHTFLTRLGESGCDAWTLAHIAGHSNGSMSPRYVHPFEDAVLSAMAKLGRHKGGHKDNSALPREIASTRLSQRKQRIRVVDVAGIEPATPCLQSIRENTMLMARLALSCVLYHGFPWYSGANGPKLDPSFWGALLS